MVSDFERLPKNPKLIAASGVKQMGKQQHQRDA
jgi:hypothetical protein